jgi:hypothetical protein
MRRDYVDVELTPGDRAGARARSTVPIGPRRRVLSRLGLDRFELAALAAFAAISLWVLGLDLWQVVAHGRVWTGIDGSYVVDQMQYLAWIRSASHHVLVSNLFVLRPSPADYLQPGVAISGGITALGVAPWLSYLLWKPVAVGMTFFAARAYVRRSLTGRSARRAALVLGLFFASFSVVYGSFSIVGDLVPGFLSWGYPFSLISVAAILIALVAYDRGRAENRFVWAPALLGALTSSLHPWQGETLILIVIGAEALSWRNRGRARPSIVLPAVTVVGTALPLAYYFILGRSDLSWHLAREGSKHAFSLWTIALALAPLALPAALAYRGQAQSFIAVATRTWPIAALGVFVLSGTALSATPLHAFVGITFPLAVLAVAGVQRAGWHRVPRRRLLGSLAIAAATIPATAYEMGSVRALVAPADGNPTFITRDERHALDYLAREREPGGVLTRFYLGTVVPAETGRHTFIGHCLWSRPDCTGRAKIAQKLLQGSLTPQGARAFVLGTGARFVLSDCAASNDLRTSLAPITRSVRRFGCASVYVVDRSTSGASVGSSQASRTRFARTAGPA